MPEYNAAEDTLIVSNRDFLDVYMDGPLNGRISVSGLVVPAQHHDVADAVAEGLPEKG